MTSIFHKIVCRPNRFAFPAANSTPGGGSAARPARANKRKAGADSPAPAAAAGAAAAAAAATPGSAGPPPAKMARQQQQQQLESMDSTPAKTATPEPERTSRSGRVIKPKKFVDDDMDTSRVREMKLVLKVLNQLELKIHC